MTSMVILGLFCINDKSPVKSQFLGNILWWSQHISYQVSPFKWGHSCILKDSCDINPLIINHLQHHTLFNNNRDYSVENHSQILKKSYFCVIKHTMLHSHRTCLLSLFTPTNTLMLDEYTSNFQHVFIYQLAGTDGCRLQKYVLLILVVIFLKYFRLPEPSVAIANYCYLLIITPSRRSTDLLGRLWR